MQKYAIIQLLEEMDDGTEFHMTSWPLHSSLADVFAVDWEGASMLEKLSELLSHEQKLETVADDDTYFGPPEKRVQVTLVKNTPELQSLHNKIVDLLEGAGGVFNEPEYTKEGFKPHSTVQKHARLHKGDTVKFNALTVVDMFPNGDIKQRKLLKTIKLLGL